MACQHHACGLTAPHQQYRKVLWFAFWGNFVMFIIEIFIGIQADSLSLLSDSLDFFGDSANYVLSLFVLNKTLNTRANASLVKGTTMLLFSLGILVMLVWNLVKGQMPNAHEMGITGFLAFIMNVLVAWALYAFRQGDSNMRSVWLCSRNDAIGNIAVIVAAITVHLTQSNIPDLIVAFGMAILTLQAAIFIIQQALAEKDKTTSK